MKIALVYGGKSGEHEISLVSAAAIARNIDSKNEIVPIAITKDGRWFLQPESEFLRVKNDEKAHFEIKEDPAKEVLVVPAGGTKRTFRVGSEEIGVDVCGTHGTTAALALLNDAVKKGGVMASSHVGGLSGAFIPVSEDQGMIDSVECGALSLEKLEAMTCVCSVGLDMIAIPGDTPATTISGIMADEFAIGMVNNKTTAVRLIPAPGKKAGDWIEFGGLLGGCPVMPVSKFSCADFINRGGRIPAPIHSFRN